MIGKEISEFVNKYEKRTASPVETPTKQAYLLGQTNN